MVKFRHARFLDGFGQATGTEVTATDSRLSRGMTYTLTGKLESVQESESRAGVVLRSRTTSYTYDQRDRLTAEEVEERRGVRDNNFRHPQTPRRGRSWFVCDWVAVFVGVIFATLAVLLGDFALLSTDSPSLAAVRRGAG